MALCTSRLAQGCAIAGGRFGALLRRQDSSSVEAEKLIAEGHEAARVTLGSKHRVTAAFKKLAKMSEKLKRLDLSNPEESNRILQEAFELFDTDFSGEIGAAKFHDGLGRDRLPAHDCLLYFSRWLSFARGAVRCPRR